MKKEIVIEINRKCALNCLHCSSNSSMISNQLLDYNDMRAFLNQLSYHDEISIRLSGGEPLLHPRIMKLLELITEFGYKPIIYTSGVLLKEKSFHDLINSIHRNVSTNVSFNFSLFSHHEDIHDFITQTNGSYAQTIHSLKIAIQSGFECEINTVPMKQNYNQIDKLIQFCIKKRVNRVNILRFIPQGRGFSNRDIIWIGDDEFVAFRATLRHLKTIYKDRIRIGRSFNCVESDVIDNYCRAGTEKMTVLPNGSILPCPAFKWLDLNIATDIQKEMLFPYLFNKCNSQDTDKNEICPVQQLVSSIRMDSQISSLESVMEVREDLTIQKIFLSHLKEISIEEDSSLNEV